MDPFLLSAIHNPRDRITVLKLDQDLEKFVKDSRLVLLTVLEGCCGLVQVWCTHYAYCRQVRLELPPMSSYQRLIVHRVAQYFRLDHTAVDLDRERRGIILHKTPDSKVYEAQ